MGDRLLVVNAGSSTLKLSIVEAADEPVTVARTTIDAWDGRDETGIARFLGDVRVAAVGHRVVHGGTAFVGPVLLDDAVEHAIAALTPLAPLHQPRALAGIAATRRLLPETPGVACFDTAFHSTLPDAAATYAVPAAWRRRWGLRRCGFHGLSHAWAARRAAGMLGRPIAGLAIVTCHLGAGASLCAVDGGRSVDTTMGFTPNEGLVMATRSGTVDPGLLVWLLRQGLSLDEVEAGIEHGGGLYGLCGTGDMRELLMGRRRGDGPATTAFGVYVHRLAREAAGMTAALGRLDAIVFTGGVGEHAAEVRAAVAARLTHLGVRLDEDANRTATADAPIGARDAPVAALVVTAREDLEIARQLSQLLASTNAPARPFGSGGNGPDGAP